MKLLIQIFLKYLARSYIQRFKPKIIGITGSVGKTSTKEAIYLALKNSFKIWASAKSYNNEIGVPLTILAEKSPAQNVFLWFWIFLKGFFGLFRSKKNYPEILILEMGSDKPGDLKYLMSIAKPDISVITRIGPAHFEAFEDMEKLIEEKSTLVKELRENDWAVLNYDDEVLKELGLRAPSKVFYYGLSPSAHIFASEIELTKDGVGFVVCYKTHQFPLKIAGAGEHLIYAVLSAFCVGLTLGVDPQKLASNLSQFQPLPGRGRILKGKNRMLIIDESYNSNPLSLVAALDFFKKRTWPYRKVAILGDMRELGSLSREYHYKIADWADFADLVILVGEEVKIAQPKLEQKGVKSLYYPDVASLAKDLPQFLKPQDLILVKGSQAVRLEKIIALILSSRYNPKDVLVRQEKEWEGGNYSN